jgi:hypothetical protein
VIFVARSPPSAAGYIRVPGRRSIRSVMAWDRAQRD